MPSPTHNSALTYRPEIDGLRALAVLSVMLFHADGLMPGGYVGVDVFFVISGYLITSLLLRSMERGEFSLIEFWERRIRRLFPALAVVISACLVAGHVWMVPEHLAEFGQSVVAQPLLIANFYFWRQSGYFEVASESQPLLHTWSLAVEEQFYLVFPLLLLLAFKLGKRPVLAIIILLSGSSLILAGYAARQNPPAAFFLPHYRIWELGIGATLAFLPHSFQPPRLASQFAGIAGISLVLIPIFFYTPNTTFPGWSALPPCLGTALIIASNSGDLNWVGRFLSLRPNVFVGKLSYSLYLWHWPVLVFLNYYLMIEANPAQLAFALAASFLLAWLTWKYVETPFRTKQLSPGRSKFLVSTAAASLVFLASGSLAHLKDGFPARFPPEVSSFTPKPHPLAELTGLPQLYVDGTLPVIGAPDSEKAKGSLLVWGDSHAIAMLPVLDELGKEYGITIFVATRPGVAPVPETWSKRWAPDLAGRKRDPVVDFINENKISSILLIARWSLYLLGSEGGDMKYLLSDESLESSTPEQSREVFMRNMKLFQTQWDQKGIRTWIMEDIPAQDRSVPGMLAQAASRGLRPEIFARSAEAIETQSFKERIWLSQSSEGAKLLNPLPLLKQPDGTYPLVLDGHSLYTDAHHLSPYATRLLRPMLREVFVSAPYLKPKRIKPVNPDQSPADPGPADP